MIDATRAAILHAGPMTPVFGPFAQRMSRLLNVPIVTEARGLSLAYLLAWWEDTPPACDSLIPFFAILAARDKRTLAQHFQAAGVPTPETHLLPTKAAVIAFPSMRPDKQWILKWPIGCGGVGHAIVGPDLDITPFWSPPFLVQEWIRLEEPEVYRLYSVAGELFGWNVRRFPPGAQSSPWVSRSLGATSTLLGAPPPVAAKRAQDALRVIGLASSFGAVDMIVDENGEWLVLEVNTDGVFHYVLRDVGDVRLERELDERFCAFFYDRATP